MIMFPDTFWVKSKDTNTPLAELVLPNFLCSVIFIQQVL